MRKPFIAGNWKMFKTIREAKEFAEEFKAIHTPSDVLVAVCAPYTQLAALSDAFRGTGIKVGAQNMHFAENGAYTGEISAAMLKEVGADYCIIGHSERRQYFNETDETVNKKLHAAFAAGILPILCVGEVLAERDAGEALAVVERQTKAALEGLTAAQVDALTIAYEPVWAIGTGVNATPEQAQEMHAWIRQLIAKKYDTKVADDTTILYGGSCNAKNAADLFSRADVDGGLIGGASLQAVEFLKIVESL